MRIIGTDLDGTVTLTPLTNFNNSRLPWCFALWLVFVKLNEEMCQTLRQFEKKRDTIVIISARPKQLERLTRWWLKKHQVPFDQLLLVGKGNGVAERKFEIIKQMKIKKFFDDDLEIVKFLKEHGINARLP